jgi:hypothetical protein
LIVKNLLKQLPHLVRGWRIKIYDKSIFSSRVPQDDDGDNVFDVYIGGWQQRKRMSNIIFPDGRRMKMKGKKRRR